MIMDLMDLRDLVVDTKKGDDLTILVDPNMIVDSTPC